MGMQDRDYYKDWLRERNRPPRRFAALRKWFRPRSRIRVAVTPWQHNFRAAAAVVLLASLAVVAKRLGLFG